MEELVGAREGGKGVRETALRGERDLDSHYEDDGKPEEKPPPAPEPGSGHGGAGARPGASLRPGRGYAARPFFSIFAHVSRRPTERLKTGFPGAASGSTAK